MKIQEFTGKTTQEAIDAGLAELGVTIADVHVDVLQEGAKGLFGLFGSKPARVRLTVMEEEREDDHGLSDLLGSFSLDEPQQPRKKKEQKSAKADKPKAEKQPEQKAEAAKADKPKAEKPKAEKSAKAEKPKQDKPAKAEKPEQADAESAPKAERAPKAPRAPKQPRQPKSAPAEKPEKEYAPMVPAQTFTPTEPPVLHDEATPAGRAQRFLMDVTKLMNVQVDVYVDATQEDALSIHMIGDTLGILIGRRGETLDALQYLTSLQVNKGRDGYIRVTLDTENYRAKREDSLRRLAQRMANRAQKTGRKVVLEPMNPYERRVLHTALQGSDVVTTHSEGEEPNRRVVITLKNQPERARQDASSDAEAQGDKPAKRRRSRRGRRGSRREGASAAQRDAQNVPETQEAPVQQPDVQPAAAQQAPEPIADMGAEE